jgi:hypothetical protein
MADSQITVKEGLVDPASWRRLDQSAPLPLQQHPAYGLALQPYGLTCTQAEFYNGAHFLGQTLLAHRKFFGLIKAATCFRGPMWADANITDAQKQAALKELQQNHSKWRWKFLTVMPELADTQTSKNLMKSAGFRRVMTGFSTIWLDLALAEQTLRANLTGKWRNQLKGAEKSDLQISIGGKKPHQYSWLLEKEAEQRSNRGYHAVPLGFVPNFLHASTPKSGSSVLSVSALSGKRKVAGALFLLHGNSATYHIGWAGVEGRKYNAQNLVLWHSMLALKEAGIRYLDLGGLNTASIAGIARFKLGLGAPPLTLVGGYL